MDAATPRPQRFRAFAVDMEFPKEVTFIRNCDKRRRVRRTISCAGFNLEGSFFD